MIRKVIFVIFKKIENLIKRNATCIQQTQTGLRSLRQRRLDPRRDPRALVPSALLPRARLLHRPRHLLRRRRRPDCASQQVRVGRTLSSHSSVRKGRLRRPRQLARVATPSSRRRPLREDLQRLDARQLQSRSF